MLAIYRNGLVYNYCKYRLAFPGVGQRTLLGDRKCGSRTRSPAAGRGAHVERSPATTRRSIQLNTRFLSRIVEYKMDQRKDFIVLIGVGKKAYYETINADDILFNSIYNGLDVIFIYNEE